MNKGKKLLQKITVVDISEICEVVGKKIILSTITFSKTKHRAICAAIYINIQCKILAKRRDYGLPLPALGFI